MYTSRPVPATNAIDFPPTYVGLVDDQAGGFFGYFDEEDADEIAKRLNHIQGWHRWHAMDLDEGNKSCFIHSARNGLLSEIIAPMNRHIGYVLNVSDHEVVYAILAVLNAGPIPKVGQLDS